MQVHKYPKLPDDWAASEEHKEFREFNEVVLRACEANAERRYQSAEEMRSDLELLKSSKSLRRLRKVERAYGVLKVLAGWTGAIVLLSAVIFGVWFSRDRAALREALLAQARLERRGAHLAGWSATNLALIQRAAAIRFSRDVKEQAAGALAGLDAQPFATLWDVAGGSAAFSSDGALLLGGTMGSPALLIDTKGDKLELPARAEGPVCWTPNGVPLQFSESSNTCLLLEARTSNVLQRFPLAQGERVIRTFRPVLAIRPDGSRVAAAVSSAQHGRVVIWDAASGELVGEAATYARALAFSEDGTVFAAGDREGNIAVYSMPAMARLLDLPPPVRPVPIHCMALTRDRVVRNGSSGNPADWLLAASYKGGEVVIWDLHKRLPRAVCRGSRWSVTSLAFHPDGQTLASGGRYDDVRFWDVASGELLLRIAQAGASDVRALAFNNDGTRVAWSTEAHPPPEHAAFWNLNQPRDVEEFPRNESSPPCVGIWKLSRHRGIQVLRGLVTSARWVWYSRDSHLVAALSDDWRVAVWELRSGWLVNIFEAPVGAFADSAGGCFDASGQRFAIAAGTEARLYELRTGRVVQQWRLPKSGLMDHLQFDAEGRLLLVRRGSDSEPASQRRWRVYELAENGAPVLLREQAGMDWVPWDIAFAAGGERFFVSTLGSDGKAPVIRAYDMATGQEVWKVLVPGVNESAMRLDPTGRWLAYQVDEKDRCRVVRLSDFREVGLSPEHCLAIGPSGDQFAVHGPEGLQLRGPGELASGLPLGSDWSRSFPPSFSPDGKLLAWGTHEGVVVVDDIREVRRRLAGLHK
ncbi:MAG: WD40 repeat domain-containing protein [Verrucomicrobia bacterium]|nr:WD40 repeat domain-containing protein [Verrucomicrobiota bacterium]